MTYKVSYSEKSDGICNRDYVYFIESDVFPTLDILRERNLVIDGRCTNISGAGCEDCGGSQIFNFKVETLLEKEVKNIEAEKIIKL